MQVSRLACVAFAFLIGCSNSNQAERLVGTHFTEVGPIVRCFRQSGMDIVGLIVVRMSIEDARAIAADSERLRKFPELDQSIQGLRLVRWTSGPLSEEGRRAFEFALEGLVDDCNDPKKLEQEILVALSKPTTYHSYQFIPVNGRVAPEALRFHILDPENGLLYELENLS